MEEGTYQTRKGAHPAEVFYLDIEQQLPGVGGWGTAHVSSAPEAGSGGQRQVDRSEG